MFGKRTLMRVHIQSLQGKGISSRLFPGRWPGLLSVTPLGWIALLFLLPIFVGCSRTATREVVVYTSQDREYAEPIFQEFTRRSGIKVRALYDSEAAKTVGLANRLLAEKSRPQCDVFWNNEELRTWQLAAKEVLETNWASIGYRSRRIVLNTNWHPVTAMTYTTGT